MTKITAALYDDFIAHAEGKIPQGEIAKKHGLSQPTISKLYRKTVAAALRSRPEGYEE